jgi:prophage DNA circulation protein
MATITNLDTGAVERQDVAADLLPQTQFGDIIFPAESHVIHGSGRKHIHEYPHRPGGAPEKLGRGLYTISIKGLFHNKFPKYGPALYPAAMNLLRAMYEAQETHDLVHPSVGTIKAFISDWRQSKTARVRSGETVDIEFQEDSLELHSATEFFDAAQSGAFADKTAALAAQANDIQNFFDFGFSQNDVALFDAIQNVGNSILALRDTADIYGSRLGAELDRMANLCSKLVDESAALSNPAAWPIVDILRDLWAAALSASKDLQSKRKPLQTFVVPRTMSIIEVSTILYDGDGTRSDDLLALNGARVVSAVAVRAGTSILYYPA